RRGRVRVRRHLRPDRRPAAGGGAAARVGARGAADDLPRRREHGDAGGSGGVRPRRVRPGPAMTWTQNYDPFGSAVLSPLAAAVPVVLLLGLLASGRVSAAVAALAGLAAAIAVAVYAFTPVEA